MSFLYDQSGKRKYLTADERRAFLLAAKNCNAEAYTFCLTLAYTGGRISEVLALTPERIDISDNMVIFECLKKRGQTIYRAIPIPQDLVDILDNVHRISLRQRHEGERSARIWSWCRTTAWGRVTASMSAAGIVGPQATPKGLRHSFGVLALQNSVPLNLLKKWLGHSRLSTTEIYADAMGQEERTIAHRFWRTFEARGVNSQSIDLTY